ncbi:hypothetical protein BDR26DRAFT_854045 [Obelidium mucronatum]|nr:hypothetical protein BDR26DRAFT_854045 [Obelidium mucronatum]
MSTYVAVTQAPNGAVTSTLYLDTIYMNKFPSSANTLSLEVNYLAGFLCTTSIRVQPATAACPAAIGTSKRCISASCVSASDAIKKTGNTQILAKWSVCPASDVNCSTTDSFATPAVFLVEGTSPPPMPPVVEPTVPPVEQPQPVTTADVIIPEVTSAGDVGGAQTNAAVIATSTSSRAPLGTNTVAPVSGNNQVSLNNNNNTSSSTTSSKPNPTLIGAGIGIALILLGGFAFVAMRRRAQANRKEATTLRLAEFNARNMAVGDDDEDDIESARIPRKEDHGALPYKAPVEKTAAAPSVVVKESTAGAGSPQGGVNGQKQHILQQDQVLQEKQRNHMMQLQAQVQEIQQQQQIIGQPTPEQMMQQQQQQQQYLQQQNLSPEEQQRLVQQMYEQQQLDPSQPQYPGYYDQNGVYHYFSQQKQ